MSEVELQDQVVQAREEIRQAMLSAPMTDDRDTYGDGYGMGLAEAISILDRFAPSIRFVPAD